MHWDLIKVNVLDAHTLAVRFRDGLEGRVEFAPSFFRGVFSALSDPRRLREAYVADGVLTWPGELDLAPDAMYEEIRRHGRWQLQ